MPWGWMSDGWSALKPRPPIKAKSAARRAADRRRRKSR